MYDANKPQSAPQPVSMKNFKHHPDDFEPHGLSVWVDQKSGGTLFLMHTLWCQQLLLNFSTSVKW